MSSLTDTQREAILAAGLYRRADGNLGRSLYHTMPTLRALARRGLVCQVEAVNNGNGSCILTAAGLKTRREILATLSQERAAEFAESDDARRGALGARRGA